MTEDRGNGRQKFMSKKIVVFVLAFAVLASAYLAEAQEPGKVYRIGYLMSHSAKVGRSKVAPFKHELKALGYVKGKNLVIEERYAGGKRERLSELAAELVRLKVDIILAHGGVLEADVVCKQHCLARDPASSADNIRKYRHEIAPAFPVIPGFEVLIPRYGLRLKPWENWGDPDGVPDWWTASNKIKHQRATEYHRASLKNVLNAVAGLFVICL